MIMIWNRKEVYMGNSLERFEKVRDTLKTIYYVYVHYKDYDKAMLRIRSIKS